MTHSQTDRSNATSNAAKILKEVTIMRFLSLLGLSVLLLALSMISANPGLVSADEEAAAKSLPKRVIQVHLNNLVASEPVDGWVEFTLIDELGTSQNVSREFHLGTGEQLGEMGEFTYEGDSVNWSIEVKNTEERLMYLAGQYPGTPFTHIEALRDNRLQVAEGDAPIVVLKQITFKLSTVIDAVLDTDVARVLITAGLDGDASGSFELEKGELVTLTVEPKDRRIHVAVPPLPSGAKEAAFLLQLSREDGTNLGEIEGKWQFQDEQNISFAITSQRLGIITQIDVRASHSQSVLDIALPNPFLPAPQTVEGNATGQGIRFVIQRNPNDSGSSQGEVIPLDNRDAGWLSLSVINDETRDPLPDAVVSVNDLGLEAVTDSRGQLTIPLEPGVQTVVINTEEFENMEIEVVIRDGETTLREISLSRRPLPKVPPADIVADFIMTYWLWLIIGVGMTIFVASLVSQAFLRPQRQR